MAPNLLHLATLLLVLMLAAVSGPADASERVRFHAAAVPPTTFKRQLARERGETVLPERVSELGGELFRPPGGGAFPAVIWLHGCQGQPPDDARNVADHLGSQYVVLFVDGLPSACMPDDLTVYPLVHVVGALDYLAAQPFVRPDRIAVIGIARGGTAALTSVREDAFEHLTQNRFAAAIAYYPDCLGALFVAPTLVLVGELDEVAPEKYCRQMISFQATEGSIVSALVVYPAAYHGFNQRRLANKPEMFLGHPMEYSTAADEAALRDISAFLGQHLGR
jgi:dienelactone hydrolase